MRLGKVRHEHKYLTIKYFADEKQWDVSWMCSNLGVSRGAYYKWLKRPVPAQEQDNEKIAVLVREYDDRFGHILGYRRMTLWLNTLNGTSYNHKRIYRVMRCLGIQSVIRKKRKRYPLSKPEETAQNLLKRDFYADRPNLKWATDVTELRVPTTGQKLYLSAILDLYDRTIVAYRVSSRNDNALVFDTFRDAIRANPDAKPLFHSDRGFQYTSRVFQQMLEDQGMKASMSRISHCIDNGPTEGLWGLMKDEMTAMYSFSTPQELKRAVDLYVDFYNNQRLQLRYSGKTPAQVRQEALSSTAPVSYPIPVNKRIEKYKANWQKNETA